MFGKAWKELSVFVEDTGGDIDEVLRKARAAGEMMSTEVVNNLDDLGDAWDRLMHHAAVAGGNIAGVVAPEITKALEEMDSALGTSLVNWEIWALGIAVGVARVRGVIEGFVKCAHRPLREMSPQNMGKDIEEGADAAEVDAVMTFLTNKLNPPKPKQKPHPDVLGGGGKSHGKSLAEKLREEMADVGKSEGAITAAERDANTQDLSSALDGCGARRDKGRF